jgi:hypothetical protein
VIYIHPEYINREIILGEIIVSFHQQGGRSILILGEVVAKRVYRW